MVFTKLLSRTLLSLFVFSTSNIVVSTFASEYSSEHCETYSSFESWCGIYSFNERIDPRYNEFINKIKEDEKIFSDYSIKLLDIKNFYRKISGILYET